MSLKFKLLFILFFTWIFGIATLILISYAVILQDYRKLEIKEVKNSYYRFEEALQRTKDSLQLLTVDWAHWDASYQFLKDKNDSYKNENLLNNTTFQDTKINFILFFDDKQHYFDGSFYSSQEKRFTKVPDSLLTTIINNKELTLQHDKVEQIMSGFIKIPEGIIFLSSFPVSNSTSSAKPNGNIIMGYLYDQMHLKQVENILRLKLNIVSPDEVVNGKKILSVDEENGFVSVIKPKYIYLYKQLKDVSGKVIGVFKITIPRTTYLQGKDTIFLYTIILFTFGLCLIGLIMLLLKYFIINRIEVYRKQLQDIASTKNFSSHLKISGQDEITEMVKSSNEMLNIIQKNKNELDVIIQNLTESNTRLNKEIVDRVKAEKSVADLNHKLIVAARLAGMADISASVLHNVGNVLTSINTSIYLLHQNIASLKPDRIKKMAHLLIENQSDLTTFFTKDPAGQKLPEFITLTGEKLEKDQQNLRDELSQLRNYVNHITNIISMQQNMSRKISIIELIAIPLLIKEAITICKSYNGHENIKIIYELDELKEVKIDHVNLLQIVVNLIKNAHESIIESKNPDKRIIIRLYEKDKDNFVLEITDTGLGISKDVLQKIYNSGFTTKKNGNGYGLHSSSLAAKEMGGELEAASEGLGKGATFTLTLPYQPRH